MKIMIVEDERDLNNVIAKHLRKHGFSTDSAFHGEEALDYLAVGEYDLIILDIMMPKMNGYDFLKKIREQKNDSLVLMLTAKDATADKIKGLDLGADDYLVKPFDFDELLARIRALIRRKYGNSSNEISVRDLNINLGQKSVTRAGREIDLTAREYEILEYLVQNKNCILSRDKIREHIWSFDYEGESNVIDVLIKNIRKKIDADDLPPIIQTKRGLGYVVRDMEG